MLSSRCPAHSSRLSVKRRIWNIWVAWVKLPVMVSIVIIISIELNILNVVPLSLCGLSLSPTAWWPKASTAICWSYRCAVVTEAWCCKQYSSMQFALCEGSCLIASSAPVTSGLLFCIWRLTTQLAIEFRNKSGKSCSLPFSIICQIHLYTNI